MGDHIQLTEGVPWEPRPDARLVETWHYYDFPLAGVVEQHGVDYAFWCVEGQPNTWSVWAYVHVSPEDERAFRRAENLFDKLDQLGSSGRDVVVALAHEPEGIVDAYVVEGVGANLAEAVAALIESRREVAVLLDP